MAKTETTAIDLLVASEDAPALIGTIYYRQLLPTNPFEDFEEEERLLQFYVHEMDITVDQTPEVSL